MNAVTQEAFQGAPSPRVRRLKERIVKAPQEVCVERARILTRAMTSNWDRDPLTRMSLGLEQILREITVTIRKDELIVGCRTSKLKGAPLFPENKIRWIEGDTENLDRRVDQRALITEEEKQEILREIVPFWKGRTVEEYFERLVPPRVAEDMDKYVFTSMLEITYGIGHFTMDHGRVLREGLAGIMQKARDRLEKLPASEREGDRGLFYQAVIRSLRAAVGFAGRYATLADRLAREENDAGRAEELRRIAQVCRRVPGQPARTFHEAVQSVYFIHLIAQIETGGNSISLGRLDQVLYPYYKQEREKGTLTRGGAMYNSTGVQFMGFSNVADSLTALRKAVFEEKRFSMGQVAQWLSEDWEEAQEERRYLRHRIPHYGNDLDEADETAARVMAHFADCLSGKRNFRGGALHGPGIRVSDQPPPRSVPQRHHRRGHRRAGRCAVRRKSPRYGCDPCGVGLGRGGARNG